MEEEKLSKKQRKEIAKEKRREERNKEAVYDRLKKAFVALLAVIVLGFLGIKVWKFITTPAPQVAGEATAATETDHVKGKIDAPVSLVEYSDFECPACKNYSSILKKLSEEYGENLVIVYRHFPLITIHKNAFPAARAAEAADKQGKFWEMHDKLFDEQSNWAEVSDAKQVFVNYAKSLGLDEEKFVNDYDSEEVKGRVERDLKFATSLSLNYTPTLFVNGRKIQPQSYEDLKAQVDRELNQGSN